MYKLLGRPLLFALSKNDPENAHDFATRLLERVGRHYVLKGILRDILTVRGTGSSLAQNFWGTHFPNPVGLAAGMDKHGTAIQGWDALGLGFIEIGGVVPLPQPGNARPRMFRLRNDKALINRMGFNSPGVAAVKANLRKYRPGLSVPLGINLGKNKDTTLSNAVKDYLAVAEELMSFADFLVVNVSSPNTPGLRQLQDKGLLLEILTALQELNRRLYNKGSTRPILVKVAPDLTHSQFVDVAEVVLQTGIKGVVAVNTTISRDGLREDPKETGGLSGPPLRRRAIEVMRLLRELLPTHVLIGVGGISSGSHAADIIVAGANLVQVLTGFVYEGPLLAHRINCELATIMQREGWDMNSIHPNTNRG
ncbi:MAG: quinone-dependent dihydroorotate dehydrogenase [bacterium]|nr:quinone-dependent dihydroorotate dehydrogenase [bacterium]